jgi:hypothetical protein
MLIINLTASKESDNVVAIMFHALNEDWFIVLFPLVDTDFKTMKEHYIGKDFYETKKAYKGCIYEEEGKHI